MVCDYAVGEAKSADNMFDEQLREFFRSEARCAQDKSSLLSESINYYEDHVEIVGPG